jgi:ketosteroid isomerase-like protein
MEESADAARGLARLYAAFNARDRAAFDGCVVDHPDAFVIGTQRSSGDRAGWMRNFDDLVAAGADVRLADDEIRAWADGDWAWAVDSPAFLLPGGGRLPTRLTAVLARRDGEWRVVHGHFSVAVPDETAVQQAPAWLEQLGEPPGPGA